MKVLGPAISATNKKENSIIENVPWIVFHGTFVFCDMPLFSNSRYCIAWALFLK
jgi:hypothetical protein